LPDLSYCRLWCTSRSNPIVSGPRLGRGLRLASLRPAACAATPPPRSTDIFSWAPPPSSLHLLGLGSGLPSLDDRVSASRNRHNGRPSPSRSQPPVTNNPRSQTQHHLDDDHLPATALSVYFTTRLLPTFRLLVPVCASCDHPCAMYARANASLPSTSVPRPDYHH
jgi:hypothetical protein